MHLLEEVNVSNERAMQRLGYQPTVTWQDAIRVQLAEMAVRQTRPMPMARPVA